MIKFFKIKNLLTILLVLAVSKLILVILYFFTEIAPLSAKEGNATYMCPPEVSDFLNLEKERILIKAKEIESREVELKLLEKRLEEQLDALRQLSQDVEEKLNKISAIHDERLKLLIKAYSEMSPSKAANQLINMDIEMAVKILSQLKSNQVASILSAMPPEKAAIMAEALSGSPPRQY